MSLAGSRRLVYELVVDGFDSKLLHEISRRAKRELRRKLRAARQALPPRGIAQRSEQIAERVLSLSDYRSARSVACFAPMPGKNEVDLSSVDAAARRAQKVVYYPFMDPTESGFRTGFRLVADPSELVDRGRGFAEPPPAAPEAKRGDIDLVLVPALAADGMGQRLGYGAGFYDSTLPDVRPPARAVVVVFGFQLLAELPVEEHDVRCDVVVSDDRIIEIDP